MNNLKIDEIIIHDKENVKGFFYDYSFLSNFHLCEVKFRGDIYPSAENAYQFAKLPKLDLELKGYEMIKEIFINCTPFESKKFGKSLLIRNDWDEVKSEIMFEICLDKFQRNKDLKEFLILTEEKYLEETNYWNDKYWGVCKSVGMNILGEILMKIRKEIKK